MKLNFQLTTLLLTLTVGLAQTALAQESARAVVWCVTTSSKAKSLEKAREAHKALLEGLREQQTLLKVEDEDIFIDSPELHRIMYRTRPGGYEFRQTVYLRQRDIARFDDFLLTVTVPGEDIWILPGCRQKRPCFTSSQGGETWPECRHKSRLHAIVGAHSSLASAQRQASD